MRTHTQIHNIHTHIHFFAMNRIGFIILWRFSKHNLNNCHLDNTNVQYSIFIFEFKSIGDIGDSGGRYDEVSGLDGDCCGIGRVSFEFTVTTGGDWSTEWLAQQYFNSRIICFTHNL